MTNNKNTSIKEGGAYVGGNVNTGGGKFVGRDDNSTVGRTRKKRRSNDARKSNAPLVKSLVAGTVCIIGFEMISYLWPWQWLLNHPNTYGLQVAVDVLLLLSAFAFFYPAWRKPILSSMLIPIFGLLLGLLKAGK